MIFVVKNVNEFFGFFRPKACDTEISFQHHPVPPRRASGQKSIFQKYKLYRPFPCCQIKCTIPFIDEIVIHSLFDSFRCCLSRPKYPILAVQITIIEIRKTSAKTKLKSHFRRFSPSQHPGTILEDSPKLVVGESNFAQACLQVSIYSPRLNCGNVKRNFTHQFCIFVPSIIENDSSCIVLM